MSLVVLVSECLCRFRCLIVLCWFGGSVVMVLCRVVVCWLCLVVLLVLFFLVKFLIVSGLCSLW